MEAKRKHTLFGRLLGVRHNTLQVSLVNKRKIIGAVDDLEGPPILHGENETNGRNSCHLTKTDERKTKQFSFIWRKTDGTVVALVALE